VTVTTPPRGPEIEQNRDLAQRVAELEALIEEARRRARRRRRCYGAVLLVAFAAGGVYFGFDHGGGATGSQPAEAGSSGGAASGVAVAAGGWAPSHGPYGGHAYVVAAAPGATDIVYVGTASGVFASRSGGRRWQSAGLARSSGGLGSSDRLTSLAVDPRAPGTVYAADGLELFKSTNGGGS
jgi:hypothetical protein